MADQVQTEVTPEAALTPEQIAAEAAEYQRKVASLIVPQVIVDRLVRHHGFQLDTEEDAQRVVKAAVDLFYMKHDGLITMEPEEVESNNPLVKAAQEVSEISHTLAAKQQGERRVRDVMLSNPEIMKLASAYVSLAQA